MAGILDTKLTYLPGVGPKRAEALARDLDLHTYADLLHYYPYRYVDRSRYYTTRELRPDMPYIQLRGYIRSWRTEGVGRKERLIASFYDEAGMVELMWFRGGSRIRNMYQTGREYIVFGKPTYFNGAFSIPHPEIDTADREASVSGGLVPMYNTSEKMKHSGLPNRQIRQMLFTLLNAVGASLRETLPPDLIERTRLMSYQEAIVQIHFPDNAELLEAARRRLKFDELLLIQLKMQSLRHERHAMYQGFVFGSVGHYFNSLYREHLPFDLTKAQKRVLKEIRTDVGSGRQMNRLVQGDVGSGKTLVALFAMLLAVDNGYQACLMAPTEILARQHHAGLCELLEPLGLGVELLIGSTTKRQRARLLPMLASAEAKILVGTHTLIEESVQFARLGIAVIDEQHRFGVLQRARLWTKTRGVLPHILIMSATPIPRTLAMTLYGDLDISVIDELPPGRQPVRTFHQYEDSMPDVYRFLRTEIEKGRQAYVVYPMIEEREREDLKDLESGHRRYCEIFPDLRIAMVHGKMKAKDKDAVMQEFISGRAHMLLATTVIEVGVNVPNASVMIIESANRFGLSQLHQLRGRVGRGAEQSYCILVSGRSIGQDAQQRLGIMVETTDGFVIAEQDMRLRGFGELEGTRQSGKQLSLKIANPARDGAMVQYTRELAESILSEDPELTSSKYATLKVRLSETFDRPDNWGAIS